MGAEIGLLMSFFGSHKEPPDSVYMNDVFVKLFRRNVRIVISFPRSDSFHGNSPSRAELQAAYTLVAVIAKAGRFRNHGDVALRADFHALSAMYALFGIHQKLVALHFSQERPGFIFQCIELILPRPTDHFLLASTSRPIFSAVAWERFSAISAVMGGIIRLCGRD